MSGLRTFEQLPEGVDRLRPSSLAQDAWLVRCRHAPSQRATRPPTPSGDTLCTVCKGDDKTTAGYSWPVQLIAVVPKVEDLQEALF